MTAVESPVTVYVKRYVPTGTLEGNVIVPFETVQARLVSESAAVFVPVYAEVEMPAEPEVR